MMALGLATGRVIIVIWSSYIRLRCLREKLLWPHHVALVIPGILFFWISGIWLMAGRKSSTTILSLLPSATSPALL